MKHRDDDYLCRLFSIQDHIREVCYYCLPYISVNRSVNAGMRSNSIQYDPHPCDEVHAQAGPLLLVPIGGGVELGFGLRQQSDRQAHRRSRASASVSTCSHGMAACGFALCAARRRSIPAAAPQ